MTDKDLADWLADKIVNGGDYAKQAASVLRTQANQITELRAELHRKEVENARWRQAASYFASYAHQEGEA